MSLFHLIVDSGKFHSSPYDSLSSICTLHSIVHFFHHQLQTSYNVLEHLLQTSIADIPFALDLSVRIISHLLASLGHPLVIKRLSILCESIICTNLPSTHHTTLFRRRLRQVRSIIKTTDLRERSTFAATCQLRKPFSRLRPSVSLPLLTHI